MTDFITSLPEIVWPAMPAGYSAGILASLFQLEATQWRSSVELAERQFEQLAGLVRHACETVPYYHDAFAAAGLDPQSAAAPERWHDVPLLSRRDIQLAGSLLHSRRVPPSHGTVGTITTSGSTSAPVSTLRTGVTEFFWRVLTLREHFWHRRDFGQTLAAIRHSSDPGAVPPHGRQSDNWGSATAQTITTGAASMLDVQCSIEEQAQWLVRTNPGYVLGYPSALLAIGRLLREQGAQLPRLREVRTFGETLEAERRAECQQSFGVKVVDMYSSQEVGYIAFQCPEHEHFHVQSESVLVEVLSDNGRPCAPGEVGKVVVTSLHNFAMPLLRYDIGDYAEVGPACPCGRGLPVLARVLGRQRNLLVLPDGTRRWPVFDRGERPEELPALFQYQVIQKSLEEIEVLAVRPQPFAEGDQERIAEYMRQTLGHPFAVTLRRVDAIPRGRTGKFEDFISEVP